MLKTIAVIFIMGLILGKICEKIHLPKLVGYILTGIIMSPDLLNLFDEKTMIISEDLRKLALVIILARAGLSLKLNDLKKVGRPAFLLSFVPACFEISAITILSPILFKISYLEGAIIGCVVAAVSPAVVVPSMIKIMDSGYGVNKSIPQLIMTGASIDDVFVIVFFTSLTTMALGGEVSAFKLLSIPVSILCGIVLGALVGIITGSIFEKHITNSNVSVMIFLSLSFIMIEIEKLTANFLPISGLIAVMTYGIALYNKYPDTAYDINGKLTSLWIPAQIILFVLVGGAIDIDYMKKAGLSVIILIAFGLCLRCMGVLTSLIKTPLNMKEKAFCAISYMPKATVQAAIGALPLSMGLACGNLTLTVAICAILLTAPLGAFFIDKTYKKLLTK